MIEGGEISNPTIDQNPNQYFKSPENSLERPHEPYTIWFGDEITFGHKEDETVRPGIILNVGEGSEFTLSRISKTDDGKPLISPVSISSQGVEQLFHRRGTWTAEKINEAINNYYEIQTFPDQLKNEDPEKEEANRQRWRDKLDKLRKDQLARVDEWANNQSRTVTIEDIRKGKQKKV
jgi:hypothetical protein